MNENGVAEKPLPQMPYGKYKGWAVADVPLPYLRWFLKSAKAPAPVMDAIAHRAAPNLLKAMDKELARMDRILTKSAKAKSAKGKTEAALSPLELAFRDMTQKLGDRLRELQKEQAQKEQAQKEAEGTMP